LISSFSRLDARARNALQGWKAIRGKVSLREYYAVVFPWMYTPDEYARSGFIEPILTSAAANPNPQGAEAFGRHVDAVVNFDSSLWQHELAVETLIVSGQQDAITPPAIARELTSRIPRSRMILVEGAGHGLAMTSAIDPVIPEISNFIRQRT
jgi:pimeloyl-ACP methyl ester carboxylesterase